ncbi:MAG: hypothetical protein L6Q78_16205, partial [Bacteroidia bacterium]|nr:hypothetical protein [Bacteroidia bacterium]
PSNFALNASGEQLFAFQGTWTSGQKLLHGLMSGASWTTSGSLVSTSANSYEPSELKSLSASLQFNLANGYLTNNLSNTADEAANLFTKINQNSNWTSSSSQIATVPNYVFKILGPAPTIQPAFNTATSITHSTITFNLLSGNGDSVLVAIKSASAITGMPQDGRTYNANTVYSGGDTLQTGEYVIYNGLSGNISIPVTGLSASTVYHVAAFSYNGVAGYENYLTSVPGVSSETTAVTPNSTSSDIVAEPTFIEPSNIDFKSALDSSNLTTSNSMEVFKLSVRDGGTASPDLDTQQTEINSISFSISNPGPLKSLALFDGNTKLGEQLISGSTATFSGLSFSVPDDNIANLSLRATFKSTQTDNVQFSFEVSSVSASALGSQFVSTNAGGATSSITGDRNRIEVAAQKLYFGTQPTDVLVGSTMTPAITILANDTLTNTDLDFSGLVTLSTLGTFDTTSTTSVNSVSGVATFSNILYSSLGAGIKILASSTGLISSDSSNSFNVTVPNLLQFTNVWSGSPVTVNATKNPSNSSIVVLSRGTGLTSSSSSARFSATGFATGATLDLANQDFLTFTLQANPGYAFNLNSSVLTISLGSSGTGPATYGVFTSVGGFTSNSQQVGSNLTASSNQTITFPSSGYNGLSNLEIRIYGWNAGATTGSGGLISLTLTGQVAVNNNPALSASIASLPEFSVSGLSTPSIATGFDISGLNLTSNAVVNAPSGYEVSSDSLNFSSSISITPSSGTISSTRVYLRFNPSSLSDQGTKTLSITSTGANTVNINVNGVVKNL